MQLRWKRYLPIGVWLFVFQAPVCEAQIVKHQVDLSISAGVISLAQIPYALAGGGHAPYELTFAGPNLFASAKYCIINHLAVGISGGYQILQGANSDGNYSNPFTYRQTISTIAFEVTPIIVARENFMFYATIGIGMQNMTVTYSSPDISIAELSGRSTNFQITPAAIRFGDVVAGFLEVGFGYKGLINGGLAVKIGRRMKMAR